MDMKIIIAWALLVFAVLVILLNVKFTKGFVSGLPLVGKIPTAF